MLDYYPYELRIDEKTSGSDLVFGHRVYIDQTYYEILIEFLLVFTSAKSNDYKTGKMEFHNVFNNELQMEYYPKKNMALKRFVFYPDSKKDKSIEYDEKAYHKLLKILEEKVTVYGNCYYEYGPDYVIQVLQDLLKGFSVVLKSRTWCAQQFMPLCPEMILSEAMPEYKKREKEVTGINSHEIDTLFSFNKHNFLARTGEVFYLTLMQYFKESNDKDNFEKLQQLLNHLLTNQSQNLSNICNFITDTWFRTINDCPKKDFYQKMNISSIPIRAYRVCNKYTVNELISFLLSEMQLISKVDLLAKGMTFQLLRNMNCAVSVYNENEPRPIVVDMTGNTSKIVKDLSRQSYLDVVEAFNLAISKACEKLSNFNQKKDLITLIKDGQKGAIDLFVKRGKEIQCIIPYKGPQTRFTLSEDVVRFLVLAMVSPGERITFDDFLEKIYKQYNIVIGPEQFKKIDSVSMNLANALSDNKKSFQIFLKDIGLLKELSDATSIVFNPYVEVKLEN